MRKEDNPAQWSYALTEQKAERTTRMSPGPDSVPHFVLKTYKWSVHVRTPTTARITLDYRSKRKEELMHQDGRDHVSLLSYWEPATLPEQVTAGDKFYRGTDKVFVSKILLGNAGFHRLVIEPERGGEEFECALLPTVLGACFIYQRPFAWLWEAHRLALEAENYVAATFFHHLKQWVLHPELRSAVSDPAGTRFDPKDYAGIYAELNAPKHYVRNKLLLAGSNLLGT